jgi:RNA polymerase sigma-70 factor (ECF subfamily)
MVLNSDCKRCLNAQEMTKEEDQSLTPEPSTVSSQPLLDPERWVKEHGDVLFGFVATRVRDRAIAQDLVQEAFLAAIKAKESFSGRSSERAWLFGILRNKLTDYYRRQAREVPLADFELVVPEEKGAFAETGVGKDGWVNGAGPKAWETPEQVLVSKEFQETLKRCLSRLPDTTAQVFSMREVDGLSSDEICKELGISPNNLWVMLHRARLGLRQCLEVNWFGKKRNS